MTIEFEPDCDCEACAAIGRPATEAEVSEFATEVEVWLARNQRLIDEQIEGGARFIISAANMVHTLDCKSVREHLDLRSGWPFGYDLSIEKLYREIRVAGWPRLPRLETAEHVNEVRRYKRCRVCSPDVADKAPRVPTTRAGAVNRSHIGRRIGGRAVEWVRLESTQVVVGLDDGSTVPYGVDDRIRFDKKDPSTQADAVS
ncbi:hypothetical protein [Rhodococcus xishaensis]|nr:hypothetical protein [Rhodococcus xishaensis]